MTTQRSIRDSDITLPTTSRSPSEPQEFLITETHLPAAADTVWARAVTAAGINDEFRPLARMTTPRGWRGASIDELPLGVAAGRAWLLLFGVIPFECDRLTLVERGPGYRFLERSTMIAYCLWIHERTITANTAEECVVRDRVGFVLRGPLGRIPGYHRLNRIVVGFLFRHRHRRLARRWAPSGAATG